MIYHRTQCRLCNSKNVQLAFPIKPTAIADAYIPKERLNEPQPTYPLDLYLCADCGHAQLLDVISPDVLFKDYIYVSASSLNLDKHFEAYANDVVTQWNLKPGQCALDIGSNDGTLLRFLQKKGLTVLGVDPAREIAAQVTASGIETIADFFTEARGKSIRETHGPRDLVTANNVYAHADDLANMTEGVREVLAPAGIFVFEVSYVLDMIRGMVFDYIYHEHLCHHAVKPMRQFLDRHGLQLIDVQRVPTKGGSIRGVAQLKGGKRAVLPSVESFIKEEDAAGLSKLETYRTFASKVDQAKKQCLKLLQDLKTRGHKIGAFGASATSTTLIYHFELASYLDCIFDDNEQRQSLYSPGFHLPIVSPSEASQRGIDTILLLAWRYKEPIMKRHKSFMEAGGQFVSPLPELTVYGGKKQLA